jgi:signal transduction histidine kinase
MTHWKRYKSYVHTVCGLEADTIETGILYWSNRLFVTVVTFLIPFSLIALIPGVYFSITSGVPEIAALDLIIFVTMVVIGLVPGLALAHRKVIFMVSVYLLASILIVYLGAMGPGLIYLYACSVFGILIFPTTNTYIWSFYNLAICVLMGILVGVGITPNPDMFPLSVMYWVAVTSNLVFLSFLTSALLPILFRGMQASLSAEVGLRKDLAIERRNLMNALQELQQKNDELDQFATVASHDLKEPARMVHSFVKLLDTRYGDHLDNRAKKYIQFALDGSKRMLQLIEDVLNYAKAGNFAGQITRVDTNLLVEEVLNTLSEVVKDKNATIHVDKLPFIFAAQMPINLVFQNLIENAIKYSKPDVPAEVRISAAEYPDKIIFSVSDNGIGISEEYISRIFDLFRRLHSQEEYPGTGLGLAICKKIIEQHGGAIWAESDATSGTTFHFSLPAS